MRMIMLFLILLTFFSVAAQETSKEKGFFVLDLNDTKSLKETKEKREQWDAQYPDLLTLFSDESLAAEVPKAWIKFHQEIRKKISEGHFEWKNESPMRVFYKFYFSQNGVPEFLLVKMLTPVSESKKSEFMRFLREEVNSIQFSIHKSQEYSQCGSIIYQ